jgi:hypothetical protein
VSEETHDLTTAEWIQAEATRGNHAARVEIRARIDRERAARQMVVDRAGVSRTDLLNAARVLTAIAGVDLRDLEIPPAFSLLADGEVGAANTDTPEWQHWNIATELLDDALGEVLYRTA